jgi:hypothetical protein
MAPIFSKVPVAAIPGMKVISGLMCGHANCYALFIDLEDSEQHANLVHNGKLDAVTCGIYERSTNSGKMTLFRVLDEDDREYNANRIE